MNFIGRMEDHEIQVELKYCERCGGLWLRPYGAVVVYCASCCACLKARPKPGEVPPSKTRRHKRRGRGTAFKRNDLHGSARITYLQGVAVTEAWA